MSYIGLGIFISSALISIYVYIKNPKKELNIIWALFSLSVSLWGLGLFFGFKPQSYESALLWIRLLNIPPIFIPSFFVHFVFCFIDKKSKMPTLFHASSLFLAIASILLPEYFIPNVIPIYIFDYYTQAGPLFYAFSAYFSTLAIIGNYHLLKAYSSLTGLKKKQVGYVLFGTAIGFLGGATAFPLTFGIEIYPFGVGCVGVYVFTVAYAITKLELLEIRTVIPRIIALLITIALVILSTFGTMIFITQAHIQLVSISLLTVLWGYYFQKIRAGIQTQAEIKWIKDWYDPKRLIAKVASELNQEKNRTDIFNSLEQIIQSELQPVTLTTLISSDSNSAEPTYSLLNDTSALQSQPSPELLEALSTINSAHLLSSLDADTQSYFKPFTQDRLSNVILLPFNSPEQLEGVILIGDRICELDYTTDDIDFFSQLIQVISALLYRLTPYEKIEKKFLATQKKLYETEMNLMLIQSKKNEDIAHTIQEYNHEIRTPLQAIITYAEYMPDTVSSADEDELKKTKDVILSNAKRATDIIETTMRLSQTKDLEEINDNAKTCNLSAIISQSLERYVPKNQLTIQSRLTQKDLTVIGQKDDLITLFSNLIKNADEAMENTGTLLIQELRDEKDIVIQLKDSGKGIHPDWLQNIWEPYKSTHVTKGRGLGLSIVHRIITEHGGRITVASTLEEGTTFTLYFPQP